MVNRVRENTTRTDVEPFVTQFPILSTSTLFISLSGMLTMTACIPVIKQYLCSGVSVILYSQMYCFHLRQNSFKQLQKKGSHSCRYGT